MNNDAIIFDIDGTLWNACPETAKGWNIAFTKLGINKKVTPEQVESVTGKPYDEVVDELFPGFREKYPTLLDTLKDHGIEVLKSESGKFYNGVIAGIKKLASEYQIFLLSNCQKRYLNLFLNFSELKPYIAGYDCNGLSGLPKNKMLSNIKSNYSLENPVYIGDTAEDENAAELAETEFIHVSYGFGSPKKKVKSFNSFDDLVDYLMERKNST